MPWHWLLADIAALAAVLALILGAAWLARRRPWPGGLVSRAEGARLRRLATLALDPRRRVHLIEAEGHAALILCGVGPDQMILLPPAPRVLP